MVNSEPINIFSTLMFADLLYKCFRLVSVLLGSPDESYYKYAKFKGSAGPVNCLSFSQGGELLASGGDDEAVRIWEMSTKKCLDILEDPGKRWGQITCLTWLGHSGNEELKPIAFGTGRGLVVIYRRSRVEARMVELASNRVFEASDPVEAIAFDSKKSHLAITSHHGSIAVYDIGRNGTMIELWSTKSNEKKKIGIPRSVQFFEGGKKILVFILETGEMVCHDVETSREEWRKVLKSGIGNATSCPSSRQLLVDNLSKGFDLYDLPRSSPSCAFSIPNTKKCVKDGAFAEQDSVIVCGSDHGRVYIFTKSSSIPIQVLAPASKRVEVQAISTTTTTEAHFIASGVSAGSFEITVWEKTIKKAKIYDEIESNSGKAARILNLLIILLVLHWTSAIWAPLASQAAIHTLEGINRIIEKAAIAQADTRGPGMTEWDPRAILPALEEDEYDTDSNKWGRIRGEKWDDL